MPKQHINLVMRVPFSIQHDKVGYISCCPSLNVYSQGETKKVAEKNLKDALKLFISSCYKRGTLNSIMKECGFISTSQNVKDDQQFMEVPLRLVTTNNARQSHITRL